MKTLRFPPPDIPWSENKTEHWAKTRRRKNAWKEAAIVYGRQARRPAEVLYPCNVQVTIPFSTNRRRDPHNYVGTVVKSIIDGLTDAGYWPDDTYEYLTVLDPILTVGNEVIVVISPRNVKVSA